MIACLPTQALAFLAVFVYATHATQAIAFECKSGLTHAGRAAPSRWEVTAQRDGAARLSRRDFFFHFLALWPWPFDLILIGGRGIVTDYPCAKFGDFSFSRFGFIVWTDRQTDRQTDRCRITDAGDRYTHATIPSASAPLMSSLVSWDSFHGLESAQRLFCFYFSAIFCSSVRDKD